MAEGGAAKTNALYNAKGERCVYVGGGTITHSLYDREGRVIADYDVGADAVGRRFGLRSEIPMQAASSGHG